MNVSELLSISRNIKSQNEYLACIIYLQAREGLRISEILKIKDTDVSKSGNIKIHVSKSKEIKIVSAGEFSDFIVKLAKVNRGLLFQFNRFYVYREYRKLGIKTETVYGKKNAVTHAPRHILASEIRKEVAGEGLSNKLNHKNSNSSKHYGKE